MSRREISRRVVSSRVLGSANPMARWGRSSSKTCMDSFGGFFIGILLFCITFALPYCAATTEKDSKDIARLQLQQASAGIPSEGKALLQGPLTISGIPTPPLDSRTPEEKRGTTIIYYRYKLEQWETHTETHTETKTVVENGQDVEKTEEVTEEVSDWVTVRDEERWAQLSLSTLALDPQRFEMDLPETQLYFQEVPQRRRETVTAILNPRHVTVAAELAGGQLAQEADFAIVTDKEKDQLVAEKNSEEEGRRWLLIVISVILWTVSLNLIVGPAMVIFNIFPIQAVGCGLRAIVGLVSFLIALALTFTVYVAIRYWWAVALGIVLLVWLFVTVIKKGQPQPEMELPPQGPASAGG